CDMTNLSHNLTESAQLYPQRAAVRMDDYVLSYEALDDAVSRAATMLRDHGVGPGDRVALMLPNVPAFPIAYYAALRAGAVVVPMNPLPRQREVESSLGASGAGVLLAWHAFAAEAELGAKAAGAQFVTVEPGVFEESLAAVEPLAEPVARDGSDTAVILYTSG